MGKTKSRSVYVSCPGTCFMIPAEVKTPQISLREKSSSFALMSNQARASSSSASGPDSLDTALSMLVLHSGSLYREDMDLSERRGGQTSQEKLSRRNTGYFFCNYCIKISFLTQFQSNVNVMMTNIISAAASQNLTKAVRSVVFVTGTSLVATNLYYVLCTCDN